MKNTLTLLSVLFFTACHHEVKETPKPTAAAKKMASYYDMDVIPTMPQAVILESQKQHAIVLSEKRSYIVVTVKNYPAPPKPVDMTKFLVPPTEPVKKAPPPSYDYIIHFDVDKYSLSKESLSTLKDIVNKYSNSSQIIVSSYADSDGSEKYNLDLSKNRSNQVVTYLKNKGFKNLSSSYHGEADPIDPANTKEAKRKNRRSNIQVEVN